MEQLRCSRPLAGGEFALSDVLYFYKKGLESIVDDQVTQRFSSEELASWNLLTRTNQNFHYISLRLTVIWGLGVFVRYGVLFPLRSETPPPFTSSGRRWRDENQELQTGIGLALRVSS